MPESQINTEIDEMVELEDLEMITPNEDSSFTDLDSRVADREEIFNSGREEIKNQWGAEEINEGDSVVYELKKDKEGKWFYQDAEGWKELKTQTEYFIDSEEYIQQVKNEGIVHISQYHEGITKDKGGSVELLREEYNTQEGDTIYIIESREFIAVGSTQLATEFSSGDEGYEEYLLHEPDTGFVDQKTIDTPQVTVAASTNTLLLTWFQNNEIKTEAHTDELLIPTTISESTMSTEKDDLAIDYQVDEKIDTPKIADTSTINETTEPVQVIEPSLLVRVEAASIEIINRDEEELPLTESIPSIETFLTPSVKTESASLSEAIPTRSVEMDIEMDTIKPEHQQVQQREEKELVVIDKRPESTHKEQVMDVELLTQQQKIKENRHIRVKVKKDLQTEVLPKIKTIEMESDEGSIDQKESTLQEKITDQVVETEQPVYVKEQPEKTDINETLPSWRVEAKASPKVEQYSFEIALPPPTPRNDKPSLTESLQSPDEFLTPGVKTESASLSEAIPTRRVRKTQEKKEENVVEEKHGRSQEEAVIVETLRQEKPASERQEIVSSEQEAKKTELAVPEEREQEQRVELSEKLVQPEEERVEKSEIRIVEAEFRKVERIQKQVHEIVHYEPVVECLVDEIVPEQLAEETVINPLVHFFPETVEVVTSERIEITSFAEVIHQIAEKPIGSEAILIARQENRVLDVTRLTHTAEGIQYTFIEQPHVTEVAPRKNEQWEIVPPISFEQLSGRDQYRAGFALVLDDIPPERYRAQKSNTHQLITRPA